jgi:meckelin
VINLENIAAAQPNTNLFPSSADYQAGYNGILRVGIAFSMWLATALVQYLVYTLFYQRFVEDKIINFVDLCSLCNISMFILMDNQYGFYIHGRSANGIADVNMKEMLDHLRREVHGKVGGRGLLPNSDDQIFIIRVDRNFRLQYENLLRNYRVKNKNQSID